MSKNARESGTCIESWPQLSVLLLLQQELLIFSLQFLADL
jgi:hypothetical protein